MSVEFKGWPKIPRGQGEKICITEKIDGTNACIIIEGGEIIGVQSRKRLITPEDDNFGFAAWVAENNEELVNLGDGYHYGEWAGEGIQKNPHCLEGKKLFLFNVTRWNPNNPNLPKCCNVVPTLYTGDYSKDVIDSTMTTLGSNSKAFSYIAEGVIVWYCKTRRYEKYTFNNKQGKWSK